MRRTVCEPKRRTVRWVPDQPGMMPRPVSGEPSFTWASAMRKSAMAASSKSAAQGVAIEDGDERLAQPGQRIKGAVAVAHPGRSEIFRRPFAPGFDIAAGAEGFFALAGDDGGADFVHAVDELGGTLERQHHLISSALSFSGRAMVISATLSSMSQMNALIASLNHGASIPLLRAGTRQRSLASDREK